VLVDGVFCEHLSDLSGIPKDVECGVVSAGAKPSDALGAVSAIRAGVFDDLNAVMANDVVILTVPAGVKMRTPLHVVQLSTALPGDESIATSAPRLVVDVQDGAEVVLVEEFASAAGAELSAYWLNGVCEIRVGKNACVTHSMVQAQSRKAVHTRATHVTQAEESTYSLAEVNVGGAVGRHDLTIAQLGPRTSTNLACFNLAGEGQCLDLHSAVTLDHEEGKTDQVHKCIVSHATGRGVFDGNVKVNKEAQRTDAGQISRNLLLVPKATVNVKPNLQIVADDVVCTHGCTVSDLEEEELFYIQSRGLSPATARSLLVAGFGLEIASRLPGKDLRDRVEKVVRDALAQDDVVMVA
jgi:Fe-S cluster assembly protein SufD